MKFGIEAEFRSRWRVVWWGLGRLDCKFGLFMVLVIGSIVRIGRIFVSWGFKVFV
jgi:hypothetical protein